MELNQPKDLDFYFAFRTWFLHEYFKSGRAITHANLRCFPSCNFAGHTEQGFCGSKIVASIYLK
jgi:hypothetical protein